MRTNHIADGGYWRLRKGQKSLAAESLEQIYAAQLAKAGANDKTELHNRMLEEYERRQKMINHKPSAGALW